MEVVKAYEHFFFHYTQSDLLIVNTNGDRLSWIATKTCRSC
jgi:hypothetical protein